MDKYPNRIVCLTEETTETLYLLGEGDRIVGISGYTVRPPEARSKPKVSAFINARFDKIEALKPDLILAFSDLQADIAAELIRRGYPVMTFNQRSVAEILRMIRTVGALVGRQDAAEDAGRVARATACEDIRRRGDSLPRRPRVFFEEWDDPLISGICWVDELIEIAGGEPIFPELRRASLAKDRIVAPGGRAGEGPRGRHRVVVRQGDEEAHDRRARGLGPDERRPRRSHLRDQVDLHPAARTGGADRGGHAPARVHRAQRVRDAIRYSVMHGTPASDAVCERSTMPGRLMSSRNSIRVRAS